jgi:CRP/FNR family transcriptional regulator
MIIRILRANEIYAGLTEEELFLIVKLCDRITLARGATVFSEGQKDDGAVYFIEEGIIKIIKGSGEEKHKILAMFGLGNVFGEMSFLDRRERSATAFVDDDAVLYKLQPEKMEELENNAPKTAIRLLRILITKVAARLRQMDDALVDKGERIIVT